ncbi:MAG: TonB-dependent receptor [Pseudomonadota bacterium]
MQSRKEIAFGLALPMAGLLLSGSALAQATATQEVDRAASSETRRLDTVVVTAQKKEENLQDIPFSITAFDAAALEAKRIDGLEDIAQFTPGLYSTPSAADGNGVRLSLRGVGTFDPQIGVDARVAVYVDGLYLGKTQGLAFDSPDLERVEILKGPQGTLYGRNSVAGAINLISARPNSDRISGRASIDYGTFNTVRGSASINLPITDAVSMRFSGLYSAQDGWVDNTGPGENFGGSERIGGRAALRFDPRDDLSFDFAADYMTSTNQAPFYQALAGTATPDALDLFAPAINAVAGRQDEVATDFTVGDSSLDNWGAVLTGTYDFNDEHRLKLVAGWRRSESVRFASLLPDTSTEALNGVLTNNGFNAGLAALPALYGIIDVDVRPDYADLIPLAEVDTIFATLTEGQATLDGHEQFSVELTATGSLFDGVVDYTGGLYYFDETTANRRDLPPTNPRDAQDYLLVLGALQPLEGGLTPDNLQASADALGGARNSASGRLTVDTSSFAAYAQFTWHVMDRLRLTGGLRFSTEERDGDQQIISPFFGDATTLLGDPIDPNIGSTDFSSIDPAFVIEYDVTDRVLAYASRKESFRAGGFNAVAVAPNLPGETFGADFLFDKEEITAYEAGFKGDFLDGRLRANAAGFYYDFQNEQASVQTDPLITSQRIIVNTDTEVWGAEFDLVLLLGEQFTFSGNYAYTDGDPGDRVNPVTRDVEVRELLQGAPKNSYTLSLDFNEKLTNKIDFASTLTFSYKDETEVTPGVLLTNQNLLSMRLDFTYAMNAGNEAFISIWGQNLTDDEYTVESIDFSSFAFETAVFGVPRTIGGSIGVRF